jgi:hypothetical protein
MIILGINGRQFKCDSIVKVALLEKEQKLTVETETGVFIVRGALGVSDFLSLKARGDLGDIHCPITSYRDYAHSVQGS